MTFAAISPRVRIMAVCDQVLASEIETDVYTLEGVRHHLVARSFPWICDLSVYLFLSSARRGRFVGQVVVVDDEDPNETPISKARFQADFQEDNQSLTLFVELEEIAFPRIGRYSFEVQYYTRSGSKIVKADLSFWVRADEE